MIRLGETQELVIVKTVDFGVYLAASDKEPEDRILLPIRQVPEGSKVGDKLTLSLCRVNGDYSLTEFDVEITLVEDKGGSEPITTTQYYVDPFEFFNQFGFGY